jgi:general secretion pathway protein A
MYKAFFGLNRNPFELSPDPSFMCPLGRSQEAVASIYHAILRRKGFVVLTGEVGTGKTLAVRYLCQLWKDRRIPFANIIGPRLSVTDFLNYVAFDLGIKVAQPSKGNLLLALYEFLLAQFEKGLTTVLIIDEAHQTTLAVLEEIRRLSNFETAQEKLLQILLVGQPELDKKLDSFELRQLKQRIAIRCQLEPLCEEETHRYIEHRLRLAGAHSPADVIFPAATVSAIYRYSSGIPRLVNSICEQALVAAYARQVIVVPVGIIDEVAAYFRLLPNVDPGQTENVHSQVGHTESSVPEVGRQAEPLLNTQAEKAPDLNTSWSHVRSSTPQAGHTALPSEQGTSFPSIGSWPRDVRLSATASRLADLLITKTHHHHPATVMPDIDQGTGLSAAPTIGTEPSAPIAELRRDGQAVSGNTSAVAAMSEKAQEHLVTAERSAKDSSGTPGQLTTERQVTSPRAGESFSTPPQAGGAAHCEKKPKPWQSRSLTVAGIVLLFVLAGGGILLLRSGAAGNAAATFAPVAAAPPVATGVVEDSTAQATESLQESKLPGVGSAAKSALDRAETSKAPQRFQGNQLSVPAKRFVPKTHIVLLESLNRHPILHHSETSEIPSAPPVDPAATSLDDESVLPLTLFSTHLEVLSPLDSTTPEPH